MSCSLHCEQTGACCANGDVGIVCAWTNTLMATLAADPTIGSDQAIKKCAKAHYDAIVMGAVLDPYVGKPEAFYEMLHNKWGWIITVDDDGKRILADENKAECVCPLVRAKAANTPNLCNCSEGFAELMFSKVLQKPVQARVVESVLRGGKHCVYEITID